MHVIKQCLNNPQFAHLLSMLPHVNVNRGPWIAGGCARKLFEGVPWHTGDVDVFFAGSHEMTVWKRKFEQDWLRQNQLVDPASTNYSLSTWFDVGSCVKKHEHQIPKNLHKVAYVKCETNNAVTYDINWSDPHSGDHMHAQLQLINGRFAHSLYHLWQDFDFEVSCFAVDAQHVLASPGAIKDITNRTATRMPNQVPNSNLSMRVIKHHAYGFKLDSELLKHTMRRVCDGKVDFGENY